jgi:hypothetical protein
MSNLLIGSSNVNRHYKASDYPNVRQYKMVKSTQMAGFTTYMENLEAASESVLISVFENFVIDAVGADIAAPEETIDRCIKDFLTIILDSAIKLPDTKFGIVMPLRRPAVPWYQERVLPITSFIGEGIKAMISNKDINNVAIISCISETSQQFEADMIHLTKASAKVFLEVVLSSAEKFFNADMINLTDGGHRDPDQVLDVENRLLRLERTARVQADKNVSNDLMFARGREETDAGSNKNKEDWIVLNGLKTAAPLPDTPRERIESLKVIVAGIFERLIPSFKGKITYLSHGKNQGQLIPMVEVRMDSAVHAIEVRKAFADKRKKKTLDKDLESLFVSNSVTLATRVRVDVMKAIARKLTNSKDLAYVAGFTSRPMLHIRKAGAPSPNLKPLMSYSYIDSVTKFGHHVQAEDLVAAYGRAGRTFNGQLQQNFVVLNEQDQAYLQSVGQPTPSGSRPSKTTSGRGGGLSRGRGGGSGAQKRPGTPIGGSANKK